MKEIVDFFKEIFGEDFKLNGLSYKEGNIIPFNEENEKDIQDFFIYQLIKNTIWYDDTEGILYSYKPEEDSFFKKVVTNAWAFKYIFYPLFIEGWGGWWSKYVFKVYEKKWEGNYKFKYTIDNIG